MQGFFSAFICVHLICVYLREKMHFPADVRRLKDTLISADECDGFFCDDLRAF
jgi:hypothetical protein